MTYSVLEHLDKIGHLSANKHIQECLTLLILKAKCTWKPQRGITSSQLERLLTRSHRIPSVGVVWGKGDSCTLLVWIKLVQPLWKTVWSFHRKLKIELLYDPVLQLLGLDPRKRKSVCEEMPALLFLVALFAITKLGNQPECPQTDEWMKKMWHLDTVKYYSALTRVKSVHLRPHGGT